MYVVVVVVLVVVVVVVTKMAVAVRLVVCTKMRSWHLPLVKNVYVGAMPGVPES